jgi:hypothetical protein
MPDQMTAEQVERFEHDGHQVTLRLRRADHPVADAWEERDSPSAIASMPKSDAFTEFWHGQASVDGPHCTTECIVQRRTDRSTARYFLRGAAPREDDRLVVVQAVALGIIGRSLVAYGRELQIRNAVAIFAKDHAWRYVRGYYASGDLAYAVLMTAFPTAFPGHLVAEIWHERVSWAFRERLDEVMGAARLRPDDPMATASFFPGNDEQRRSLLRSRRLLDTSVRWGSDNFRRQFNLSNKSVEAETRIKRSGYDHVRREVPDATDDEIRMAMEKGIHMGRW